MLRGLRAQPRATSLFSLSSTGACKGVAVAMSSVPATSCMVRRTRSNVDLLAIEP